MQRTKLWAAAALILVGTTGMQAASTSHSADQTLQVSANHRYFQTADGKPWFWMGDTAWSLLTAYTPAEQKIYLDGRAAKGFTVIQTVAAWDGGTGTEQGPKPNANTMGAQPWNNHNPLQPNEAYWKNVDQVVERARQDGMYVGLLPAWGSFVVNYKMITPANAEAYGRWLGQRYKNAPNIIWILGGDRDLIWYGKGSEAYTSYVNTWRALARGLQQGDGGAHLITLHPGGYLRNNQQETWLAADMIQTWAWYYNIPKQVAIDYNLQPTKPVILAEGAYEDGPEYPTKPINALLVRRQAYWTYLSGGFFTYGHNDSWRKNPTWQQSLNSPGAQDMLRLRQLFHSLHWWELQPDQQLFTSGEGSGKTLNVAAISSRGDWAMAYLSTPCTVALNTNALHAKHLRVTWINPATGERRAQKNQKTAAAQSFETPAGWQDAVLLLERK